LITIYVSVVKSKTRKSIKYVIVSGYYNNYIDNIKKINEKEMLVVLLPR
jgi:hypothetical protein